LGKKEESNLKQQALAHFTDIYLIAIAFFLFFSVFLGYIFWVCRKGSKKHYDYLSQLPLHEEKQT
jgi:cbb3-type cytochrome oxidase subunit 3